LQTAQHETEKPRAESGGEILKFIFMNQCVKQKTKSIRTMCFRATAMLMAAVFLFLSCASIVSKSTYPFTINSSPSDARVSITDKKGYEVFVGNTPAVARLKAGNGFFSKAEYQVKISTPGYDTQIIPVTFSLDGWYFGNILLGGLIGMLIVDPATGAMWKIDREFINVTLSQSTSFLTPEMRIFDINEIPEDWKGQLVKLN